MTISREGRGMTLGDRIRTLRLARGMQLQDVARATTIDLATLWRIEGGITKNPSVQCLCVLARCFGVTTDELLGMDDPTAEVVYRKRTSTRWTASRELIPV